jgi:chorismate mutase/prephenate dehydratase
MKLEDCRKVIDAIDTEIVGLLNRRADLSRRIGRIKTAAGIPIVDKEREENVLRGVVRDSPGDIADMALISIYREILDESRRIQGAVARETAKEPVR